MISCFIQRYLKEKLFSSNLRTTDNLKKDNIAGDFSISTETLQAVPITEFHYSNSNMSSRKHGNLPNTFQNEKIYIMCTYF
jgi:hypothetical protein